MSYEDDLCDFCGTYIDPIGGDGSRVLHDRRYWCGQCREGRNATWGHLTNAELNMLIAQDDFFLAENPLWIHAGDSPDTPGEFLVRLHKIDARARIAHLRELLKERQQQRPD